MPASVATSAAPMERLPERHRKTTGRSPSAAAGGTWSRSSSAKFSLCVAVGRVPLDVHHLAAQAGQVGHTDEPPFGVGAHVDQHRLGVVAEHLPCLEGRDISCVAHPRESRIFSSSAGRATSGSGAASRVAVATTLARRSRTAATTRARWRAASPPARRQCGSPNDDAKVAFRHPQRPGQRVGGRRVARPAGYRGGRRPAKSSWCPPAGPGWPGPAVRTPKAAGCAAVTQALSAGRAVTSAKYTSSPLIINSTPKTPRPPSALTIRAAIDLAASSAAVLIFCGCQDSSTSASLARDGRWASRSRSPARSGRRCAPRAG